MSQTERSRATTSPAPIAVVGKTTTSTLILTRPGDGWRARRIRHLARRTLLADHGLIDPWAFSVPLDADGWPRDDIHRDGRLGWPERDRAGRELAAAGCP